MAKKAVGFKTLVSRPIVDNNGRAAFYITWILLERRHSKISE